MLPLLVVFGLAAILSLALTPITIVLARRLAVLDRPGGYKAHAEPTPLLGGLAPAGAMLFALLLAPATGAPPVLSTVAPLGIGVTIVILAGLIDDARGMSARYKFLWQVSAAAVAAVAASGAGVRLELFLHGNMLPITVVTLVWIVSITNAVNFLDNMNGLCAGIGSITAGFLALYNLRTGQEEVALAAAALCGAGLGFLPYNFPRARIFLGDTGSMAIGYTLATLAVMGVYTPDAKVPGLAVLAPLFMLAVPIADAAIVVALRLSNGRRPWLGDRRHVSHRLVRRGLPPAMAVVVIWLCSAVCGLAALVIPVVDLQETPLIVALVVCAVAALLVAAGTRGLE